jgi:hypothetical protein
MYKEALLILYPAGIDGVHYWPYQQEAFPYLWVRLLTDAPEYMADELENNPLIFEVGIVFAHSTQGYKGNTGEQIYESIIRIKSYFQEHAMLTTNASTNGYNTIPDYLNPIESFISSIAGPLILPNAGVETTPIGIRVTHSISYIDSTLT